MRGSDCVDAARGALKGQVACASDTPAMMDTPASALSDDVVDDQPASLVPKKAASQAATSAPEEAVNDDADHSTPPRNEMASTQRACDACGATASVDKLLVCSGCNVAVESDCLVGERTDQDDQALWKCDCCVDGVARDETKCWYCRQTSGVMSRINPAKTPEQPAYGHSHCIRWDPATMMAAAQPEDTTVVDVVASISSDCCFCSSSDGVQLTCRSLHCRRSFHAACSQSRNGRLEITTVGCFQEINVFCDRHHNESIGLNATFDVLQSAPVVACVGRNVVKQLRAVRDRVGSYTQLSALVADLVDILTVAAAKGREASNSTPPTFPLPVLQVLQWVLECVPQLERLATIASTTPVAVPYHLVQDADVHKALVKTFDPPKYLGKYSGPISAIHKCEVCQDQFHERQHLFYCTNEEIPHLQHWKCTKRKSVVREETANGSGGGSLKKKLKSVSVVQHGVWKDVKIPKCLQSASDGIACGICRSAVDARGLIASRKDAKRQDYSKKPSKFVKGGCFVNASDRKSSAARKPPVAPKPSNQKTKPIDARAVRRSESGGGPNNKAADDPNADAQPVELKPQKMERLNVQRTTRWLACVAQVIRLACKAGLPVPVEVVDPSNVEFNEDQPQQVTEQASQEDKQDDSQQQQIEEEAVQGQAEVKTEDNTTDANGPDSQPIEGDTTTVQDETEAAAKEDETTVKKDVSESDSTVVEVETASSDDARVKNRVESDAAQRATSSVSRDAPDALVRLPKAMQAYLDEAKRIVQPFDPYTMDKLMTAEDMLKRGKGPAIAILKDLVHEYTRYVYMKHVRAVEKATNEKRKREEQEAVEERARTRKRIDLEAELALKKQMLAFRKKPRRDAPKDRQAPHENGDCERASTEHERRRPVANGTSPVAR